MLSCMATRVAPLVDKSFWARFLVTATVILPDAMQVTELLYTKQTQLERLAAEKAAQQLAHERQLSQARDDAERVKRCAFMCWHSKESSICMFPVINTRERLVQCLHQSASDTFSYTCLTLSLLSLYLVTEHVGS